MDCGGSDGVFGFIYLNGSRKGLRTGKESCRVRVGVHDHCCERM